MNELTKKLWIFAALFFLILGAEIAVYIHEIKNFDPAPSRLAPKIKSKIGRVSIAFIDWEFGSYSSYVAILLYTSLLK